jgi:hypothetical protein
MTPRRTLQRLSLLSALSIALCGPAIYVGPDTAAAHDWYPVNCCSGNDCFQVIDEKIIEDLGNGVYRVGPVTQLVQGSDVKVSQDGQWHICTPGWPIGKPLAPETRIRCLFVPPRGF